MRKLIRSFQAILPKHIATDTEQNQVTQLRAIKQLYISHFKKSAFSYATLTLLKT